LERRLAAILVADVVGYSRLMDEDEATALAAIRSLKDLYLEPTVAEHEGEVLKRTGDGWIISFSSISAAVQCAMDTQIKLVEDSTTKLRIGAHIGEIVFDENDFHGASVNLAQRLETEAPPGGVMISQDLYRQLSGDLAESFTDAGNFKLKNIAMPVNGFQWRPKRSPAEKVSDVPSISIEPFESAPDEAETRAATADLRDQLILRLSRRTGIKVLDEVTGRAEDCEYLVRGRLRLTPTRGRFTISLILKQESQTIWSQTYQGDTTDIFQFCDDMIEQADADMRLQINAFDAERISSLSDEELSVSELRSRAANSFYKLTMESWRHAHQLLNRALALNPDDAMALAMRGETIITLALAAYEDLSDQQSESLRQDLDRAVELSPRSDYVFWSRGLYRVFVQGDLAGALKDVERILSLNPAYPPGYDLLGFAQLASEQYDQAVESFSKAISLSEADPSLSCRYFMKAIAQFCAGDAADAATAVEQAIQLRPRQWAFHRLHAICLETERDDLVAADAEARTQALQREPSILGHRPPLPATQNDLLKRLSLRVGETDTDSG